eukprot:TRINITY_DN23329_c0_g1_i1.p1 TRINITY_DN23329_c0_g1~~TRINITY_DN23329_c0_g1_i1.p1  ORF type:complete len:295 (-),score=59.90 TRINITY_DN23329_c0_g1_i1:52-936(-)
MDPTVPKSVGLTSLAVAFARSLETEKPESQRLFYDPYAKHLTGGSEEFWRSKISEAQIQKMQGVAIRTRFIDDVVGEKVIRGPIRQIVILGVGMDCRALRLPLSQDVQVYEVDLPEVMEFKNATLKRQAGAIKHVASLPPQNHHFISMDFAEKEAPWKKSLLQSSFKKDQPTLWIMEGLLMYLKPEDIDQLFMAVKELSAAGSFIVAQHGGLPQTAASTATDSPHQIHKDINAPIQSSHSFPAVQSLLESHGFTKTSKASPFEMGDWATQRIKEAGLTKEELEGGYYLFTSEKI